MDAIEREVVDTQRALDLAQERRDAAIGAAVKSGKTAYRIWRVLRDAYGVRPTITQPTVRAIARRWNNWI